MYARVALVSILVAACGGASPAEFARTARSSNLAAVPSILALNRTGSPPEGGMTIIIVGDNLDPSDLVEFDGVPALSVSTDPNASSTTASNLVVVTPPHAEAFVDLTVTNADGVSATFHNFHYGPAPVIDSMSPSSNVRKGDRITLSGANFGDVYGVQVSVGGAIAQILSRSSTQIVFAAPKLNFGSYQVIVSNWDSQYGLAPVLLSYRQ